MKKAILVMVVAMLVAAQAGAVTTGTGTIDLYAMTNQFAPTLIPLDPSPLHDDGSGNIVGCLGEWTNLYMGGDWVKRLNPVGQSEEQFLYEWGPDGGLLAGEGYVGWVEASEPNPNVVQTISYPGVDISDTDLWISLPGALPEAGGPGGTHWIGLNYPADKIIDYTQIVVTDGTEAYTMYDIATGAGPADWLDYNFVYLDQGTQSEYNLPDEWGIEMRGGQAYRVRTFKNNLALIIPHPL